MSLHPAITLNDDHTIAIDWPTPRPATYPIPPDMLDRVIADHNSVVLENGRLRDDVVALSAVARAWRDATRHHDEAHNGRFGQCPHHVCEGARRVSSRVLSEVALRVSS